MVADGDDAAAAALGRRQRQLSRATIALVVVALALLCLATWLLWAHRHPEHQGRVTLPVNLPLGGSSIPVLLAAGALAAATFLSVAGLHTAAAMRVLSPERQQPQELSHGVRRLRRFVLHPPALRRMGAEQNPMWPSSAVPEAEDLPAPGTRLRCHVLIPAHDEEAVIAETLASLARQRRPPDAITVIADNCRDRTVEIVRALGVELGVNLEVVETVGNTERKAGALNQELAQLLPRTTTHDVVMVMDADTTLSEEFLETAMEMLEDDPGLMAVGGLFYGEPGAGLLGQFQRSEFARYQRVVARKLNRVFVLTGTAAVMRAYALRAVADARGTLVPGRRGDVYDTVALTEDNELTLAMKSLGARMTSPPQCRVTTEIMTTWRDLGRQRLRWHRGALENIGTYGLTRATTLYWGQQLGLAYGVIALYSYFLLLGITLLAADSLRWSAFWVTIGLIFVAERVVTVWAAGWRARLLAALIFPELVYAAFLQLTFVASFFGILRGTRAEWNYVPRPPAPAGAVVLVALGPVAAWGILLPTEWLYTDWYEALAIWVGFNTLVFGFLSALQLLPPRRRAARVAGRQARRAIRQT